MLATKMQCNEGEYKTTKRLPIYITPELRNLIRELMLPRIEMLRKIIDTRFIPQTKSVDVQEAGDNWPDYKIYSEMHFMTDMNGFIHLMQSSLKGLSEELMTIAGKFQVFISDNFKLRLSGREQDAQNEKDGQIDLLGRYLLVRSLIKDMDKFVKCCTRQCLKSLKERREYAERAFETKDTSDRIRLMIFDERSFNKLWSRMDSLKSFLQNFCALFEDQKKPKEDGSNAAAEGHSDKIAS